MKLLEMPTDLGEFILMAGPSGAGKTCAIASFAKQGPLWIADFDKRWRGILGMRSILGEEILSNIEVEQFPIVQTFSGLQAKLDYFLQLEKAGKMPYKTLVFESANTLDTGFLELADTLSGKGSGIQSRALGGVKFFGPTHYLFAANAFRQLRDEYLQQFKNINIILSCWVVNAWDKPTVMNDKGQLVRQDYGANVVVGQKLLLTDKAAETLPGLFDEVYEFGKDETGLTSKPTEHWVKFQSKLAKTSKEKLKNLGKVSLTNRLFFDVYQNYLK